jgi:RHS repeat-associated protein
VKLGTSASGYVVADGVKFLPAPTVSHLYADHLGTPRVITNTANTVLWRWDSDPFGQGFPNEDVDGNGVRFLYNLRFPGQYYDAETGLHYNYFRDYDPSLGRYVESDPIGLRGGLNTYAYVENNPVNDIDPEGLAPKSGPLGIAAAFGQKAIDKCNSLPSCKNKLDDLERKAKELCGKVQCKLHKDKEGHPFKDSNGGLQMCAHYQIDCWIEGQKGGENRFSSYWKLPALCWKPGDQFPTIEW